MRCFERQTKRDTMRSGIHSATNNAMPQNKSKKPEYLAKQSTMFPVSDLQQSAQQRTFNNRTQICIYSRQLHVSVVTNHQHIGLKRGKKVIHMDSPYTVSVCLTVLTA